MFEDEHTHNASNCDQCEKIAYDATMTLLTNLRDTFTETKNGRLLNAGEYFEDHNRGLRNGLQIAITVLDSILADSKPPF